MKKYIVGKSLFDGQADLAVHQWQVKRQTNRERAVDRQQAVLFSHLESTSLLLFWLHRTTVV